MTGSKGNTPETHGQELPEGSRLQEFVIERTIGFGGFGITYLARDTSLSRKVVIKEHMPDMFSYRDIASLTVRPRHTSGEMMDNYEWSMGSFMKEAEMLASIEHPNIVRILRRFEANGTAYFVMPFVEGESFDKVIKAREVDQESFTEKELREVLDPLLGAFGYLHTCGIYHRDVKPGNILVTSAGNPVLIDFGAARQLQGDKSMTIIESAGYTPFEQTESRGNVGPWSDLYALGGVMRKAITFQTPARSADRIRRDPMGGLAGDPMWNGRFSKNFLESVDHALRVDEETRWQRAEDWLEMLCAPIEPAIARNGFPSPPMPPPKDWPAPPPPPPVPSPVPPRDHQTEIPPSGPRPKVAVVPGPRLAKSITARRRKKNARRTGVIITTLLGVGVAGYSAWWYMLRERATEPLKSAPRSTMVSSPTSARPPEVEFKPKLCVPDPQDWALLAEKGDAFAQALLGESLVTGTSGHPMDVDKGLLWLIKSSTARHPLGVFLLAEQQMLRKETIPRQPSRAVTLVEEQKMFQEAFNLGFNKDATGGGRAWCAALGRAYLRGLGTATDPESAVKWLTSAAKSGHVGAQYLLGEIHETGRVVSHDLQAAVRWYEQAAKSGYPTAQTAMARICARGPDLLRDERTAFEWAKMAATSGDSHGMEILGEFYEAGTGVQANGSEAIRWYRKAVEKDDVSAKGHLGRMYLAGKWLTKNEREAFRLLKEAVDSGDKSSCFVLGSMYEIGEGVKKNPSEAVKYYKEGAEAGNLEAKNALAIHMEQGTGMPANPTSAARLYREAANGGIADAQFHLGLLYLQGKGIPKDNMEAAQLLKTAAGRGLPAAIFEWGKCLEYGIGTTKDEQSAFKMYNKARQAGISEAGFRAALMLESGRGTIRSDINALLYYKTAADSGNASAQVNLGIMYGQGRGTEKDDERAVMWYRKAADQNDKDGLVLLGMMYEFGNGTKRNPQEAAKCYRKAASQGDVEAENILKKLTP